MEREYEIILSIVYDQFQFRDSISLAIRAINNVRNVPHTCLCIFPREWVDVIERRDCEVPRSYLELSCSPLSHRLVRIRRSLCRVLSAAYLECCETKSASLRTCLGKKTSSGLDETRCASRTGVDWKIESDNRGAHTDVNEQKGETIRPVVVIYELETAR